MTQYNKQQLCDAVFSAVCRMSEGATRRQIAEYIGLKKSPHVIAMIESLVSGGWLERDTRINAKHAPEFVYFLSRKGESLQGACKDVKN